MLEKNFGWWPRNSVVDARITRAEPLSDYAASVAAVRDDPRAYDDWYFPPLEPVIFAGAEAKPRPLMPASVYTLPPTHRILGNEPWMDEEYLQFAIVLIGLIEGMRLIPEGWVHFYRAPISSNKLSDLMCDPSEIAEIIFIAANWWQGKTIEVRRAMFAALHWYCFSGLYQHEFEEFSGKYIVLDTLHWIHRKDYGKERDVHAERPSKLANAYGLGIPSWAIVQKKSCRLAEIRNALIHEGQFGGGPIGFSHLPETSLTLEFGHFLTRLIIGMLGVKCSYVLSPVNTRSIHGLGLLQRQLK